MVFFAGILVSLWSVVAPILGVIAFARTRSHARELRRLGALLSERRPRPPKSPSRGPSQSSPQRPARAADGGVPPVKPARAVEGAPAVKPVMKPGPTVAVGGAVASSCVADAQRSGAHGKGESAEDVADAGIQLAELLPSGQVEPSALSGPAAAPASASPPLAFAAERESVDGRFLEAFGSEVLAVFSTFFTDGNLIVRGGITMLFCGVSFLLMYVAEAGFFPIEARLLGATVLGASLVGLGLRLRARRRTYALILEGGGFGIIFVTVYVAAKVYALVGLGAAFLFMLLPVAGAVATAVRQNSQALASIAFVGGFLAPVLTSVGLGNSIALFLYVLILNAGVLAVAWFKAWRPLNILGFTATVGIGAYWASEAYAPDAYVGAQIFLVLFFLFYVAISLLYATRQPPRLKGLIDGTLVFAMPVAAFGLQVGLLDGDATSVAISAVVLSGFYAVLALVLQRQGHRHFGSLAKSFIALSVLLGTLAVPLTLDAQWTTISWVLEAVVLVWVGLSTKRVLPRAFGLFVLAAGFVVCFMGAGGTAYLGIPQTLAGLVFAAACLLCGVFYHLFSEALVAPERKIHAICLAIGLVVGAGFAVRAIEATVPGWNNHRASTALTFLAFLTAALSFFASRTRWVAGLWSTIALPPAALLAWYALADGTHLFAGWGVAAWSLYFAAQYYVLRPLKSETTPEVHGSLHVGVYWILVALLTHEAAWLAGRLTDSSWVFSHAAVVFVAALSIAGALRVATMMGEGMTAFRPFLRLGVGGPLAVCIGLALVGLVLRGDPQPIRYIPILNPLELSQLVALGIVFHCAWHPALLWSDQVRSLTRWSLGAAAFLLLTTVVARSIAIGSGFAFRLGALGASATLHAALSITWAASALALMGSGARVGSRIVWKLGAALLAVVVAKMMFVDLDGTGSLARIVSFLGVGLLMLVIGYVAPVPRTAAVERSGAA